MSEVKVDSTVDPLGSALQAQGVDLGDGRSSVLGASSSLQYEDCKDTQVVPEVPEEQPETASCPDVRTAQLKQHNYINRNSVENSSSSSGECTSGAGERQQQNDRFRCTPTPSDQQDDIPVKIDQGDDPKAEPSGDNVTKTTDSDKPSQTEFTVKERGKPKLPRPETVENCPRCGSAETKFCYYNNYNIKQPRFFCKACQRYWTAGGTLRDVPVGSGRRKSKSATTKEQDSSSLSDTAKPASNFPVPGAAGGALGSYPSALQQVLTDPSLAYSAVAGSSQPLTAALSGFKLPGVLQLPQHTWPNGLGHDFASTLRPMPSAPQTSGNAFEQRLLNPTSATIDSSGTSSLAGNNTLVGEDGSVDGRRLRVKTSSPDSSLGASLGLAALTNPTALNSLVNSGDRDFANIGGKDLNKSLLTGALMEGQLANRAGWLQQAHNWPLLQNSGAVNPQVSAPLDLNTSILQQTNPDWLNIAAATANKQQQQVAAAQVAAAVQAAAAANQSPAQVQAAAQAAQAAAFQVQAAQAAVAQAAAAQAAGWPQNQVNPYWSLWPYNNYAANAAAANYMAAAAAAAYGGGPRIAGPGGGWNPITEAAAAAQAAAVANATPTPSGMPPAAPNANNLPSNPAAAAVAGALAAAQAAMQLPQALQSATNPMMNSQSVGPNTPQNGLNPWAAAAQGPVCSSAAWPNGLSPDVAAAAGINMPWGNWPPMPPGMNGTPPAPSAAAALNPALNQFASLHQHMPSLSNLTAALKAGNSPSQAANNINMNSLAANVANGSMHLGQ